MNTFLSSVAVLAWGLACDPGEARRVVAQPWPSSLAYGAIHDGHLLSNHRRGDSEWFWTDAMHADPKRAMAALRKDDGLRWFWADMARAEVKPLEAVLPEAAKGLSQLKYTGLWTRWPWAAPHRWRLGCGYFWATRAEGTVASTLPVTCLLRMAFPEPAPIANGGKGKDAPTRGTPLTTAYAVAGSTQAGQNGTPEALLKDSGNAPPRGSLAIHVIAYGRLIWHKANIAYDRAPAGRTPRDDKRSFRLDWDIVPLSPWHLALFLLTNDRVTVWEYSFRPVGGDEERGMELEGHWTEAGAFPAPFGEPFHVAAGDGAYFFVTDSGALYAAEEAGGQWKTRTL
ncbi:MAG: hypothetical protein NUV77_18315 [Thermoguttaceae bacterium]|nr:hypothetical protein [Thermoguttaceae bacterium]